MKPIMITASSSGGKWTKEDSPYLPLTIEENIEDIVKSYLAGAAMVHLHARDEAGNPTFEPKYFEMVISEVKKRCPGVIIQMSTGRMEGQVAEKLEPLMKLRPDLASFNLKGTDEETVLMAEIMEQYGVRPAIECFTLEMVEKAKELIDRGLIKPPVFAECVFDLEEKGTFAEKAEHLLTLSKNFPEQTIWSQTRGCSQQTDLQALSIALGGHVRTGLEDNLYLDSGEYAPSSSALVEKAVELVQALGRRVATPEEAREMLGL